MEVGIVAMEEWHEADSMGDSDRDLGNGYLSRQEYLGRSTPPKSQRVHTHTQGIITRTPTIPCLFGIIFSRMLKAILREPEISLKISKHYNL